MNPDETLLHFVRLLRQRYQAVLAHTPACAPRVPFLQKHTPSLALAEAFLRLLKLPSRGSGPLHIAVIGPTQAGKSSVVNCLCRQDAARVSPLAGYTVHPQGFCINADLAGLDWLNDYYAGFQRLPPEQLPRDRYDCYALGALQAQACPEGHAQDRPEVGHPLPPLVLWDTPDFDSIDAESYQEGVLRTAALADVLLVVVSKDKYADQSVWDILQLLAPLAQPTVLCFNKIAEDSRELVEASFAKRWIELRGDTPPAIVSLPYRQDWGPVVWQDGASAALIAQLVQAVSRVVPAQHGKSARRLLAAHWDAWLEPVLREQKALIQWNGYVEEAVSSAVKLYQRDYLNHPQHYETFQRTLVELLALLEIPGLAKPLRYIRRAVTWPLRQIGKVGQWVAGNKRTAPSNESLVLDKVAEHLLLRVAESALQQREQDNRLHGWWNELGRLLQSQRKAQQQAFATASQRYQRNFQAEIDNAAQRLLERLRQHPAVLNSLRASRATADAASLALAFHVGGVGLHDFILAPVVLSITTLLTESALGRYLHKVQADLKQRQRDNVTALLQVHAEQQLLCLPEQLDGADKFNIPAQTVATAKAALNTPIKVI